MAAKMTARFDNPLQQILEAELDGGNRVREVSEWLPRCRKFVLLERSFKRRHLLAPGVEFESLNDPHYWMAEYRVEVEPGVWECLACAGK